RFGLGGRKAAGGLFALDGRLEADNLVLRAQGLGNLAERRLGPRGLAVDAGTAALSRIVGGPKAGAAHVTGVLTGAVASWRFAGAGDVADLNAAGYGLARA